MVRGVGIRGLQWISLTPRFSFSSLHVVVKVLPTLLGPQLPTRQYIPLFLQLPVLPFLLVVTLIVAQERTLLYIDSWTRHTSNWCLAWRLVGEVGIQLRLGVDSGAVGDLNFLEEGWPQVVAVVASALPQAARR